MFLLLDKINEPSALDALFNAITALISTVVTVMGVWVKLWIDKKKTQAETAEARKDLISKMKESDEKQTAQITEIQGQIVSLKDDINEQKELTKAEADLRKLKIRINETFDTVVSANEVSNQELIMTLQNAKDKAVQVFSAVFVDEFDTDESTLKNQLIIKAKDVKRTINPDKLDVYSEDIRIDLTEKLKHQITNFVIDYSEIKRKENGVRRKAFTEASNDFVKSCMNEAINTLSK